MLEESHEAGQRNRYTIPGNLPVVDIHVARERARGGDFDGAIEIARRVVDAYLRNGEGIWLALRRRHWSSRC